MVDELQAAHHVIKPGNNGKAGGKPVKTLNPEITEYPGKTLVGKNEKDCRQLRSGGQFADKSRTDFKRNGHHEEDGNTEKDNEIPADNDDRDPPGNDTHYRQGEEATRQQRLVRDGIEIGAECGLLIQYPGKKTVQGIGKAGEGKKDQGLAKGALHEEDDDRRDKDDSQQR